MVVLLLALNNCLVHFPCLCLKGSVGAINGRKGAFNCRFINRGKIKNPSLSKNGLRYMSEERDPQNCAVAATAVK